MSHNGAMAACRNVVVPAQYILDTNFAEALNDSRPSSRAFGEVAPSWVPWCYSFKESEAKLDMVSSGRLEVDLPDYVGQLCQRPNQQELARLCDRLSRVMTFQSGGATIISMLSQTVMANNLDLMALNELETDHANAISNALAGIISQAPDVHIAQLQASRAPWFKSTMRSLHGKSTTLSVVTPVDPIETLRSAS